MPDAGSSPRLFRLLYIEDNPSDVRLVREALRNFHPDVALTSVSSGPKGLAYLRRQDGYASARRPHLVLLDLNLPGMKGEEVLLAIKNDPNLKALPVVVFTSAASELTCKTIYHENANTCVEKPCDLDAFFGRIQLTCRYWFSVANLAE